MLRPEKLIVKAFYDTYGWVRGAAGVYHDSADFSDRRAVLSTYERKTNARIIRCLEPAGRFFLDAGSGAIPDVSNLEWSHGFERRVCLDISRLALKQARATLAAEGLYVQGDVTSLPFPDGTFGAIVCAHALYHVPADEQAAAVEELYRTLAPGATCVIIYASPRSRLSNVAVRLAPLAPRRLVRKMRAVLKSWTARASAATDAAAGDLGAPATENYADRTGTQPRRPPLYFHAHGHEWFARTFGEWDIDVRIWRAADYRFTRSIVSNGPLGRLVMAALYRIETAFPRAALEVGAYPMVVIRKPER